MQRVIFFLNILISAFLFMACEKKELPVSKFDRGNALTVQIEMGPTYKNQIWYSLSDDKVVSINNKVDWDLGFEASTDGWHIILNGSKSMRAYKTNFASLNDITDTTGLGINGKADVPSGNIDSTAIGDWTNDNKVYVISRGYNDVGQHQGYYKLKINSVSGSQFTFEYGDIFGTTTSTGIVTKNSLKNFIMFSLESHEQKDIEPAKGNYDLCFTQYSHFFTNPFQYYQVTGVVINSYKTRVARVYNKAFNAIIITDTLSYSFSENHDIIGYDWKTFDLNNNLFTIDPSKCYIINDSKGFYYKLHFVDFYDQSGNKGYPKFEFQKL